MQEILDQAEQRAVELARRDVELLGLIDEKALKEQVKEVVGGARLTLIFALAGAQSTRNAWAAQDRLALGHCTPVGCGGQVGANRCVVWARTPFNEG